MVDYLQKSKKKTKSCLSYGTWEEVSTSVLHSLVRLIRFQELCRTLLELSKMILSKFIAFTVSFSVKSLYLQAPVLK